MNPVSPLPVFFALAAAMATVYVLGRLYDNQPENAKFLAVDGLRGYLAFFVFLHHACIYYFYLKTYAWELPPSRLYSHLGSASVSLFCFLPNSSTEGISLLIGCSSLCHGY